MIQKIVIDTPYANVRTLLGKSVMNLPAIIVLFFRIDLLQTQMEIQRRFRLGPYCRLHRKPADQRRYIYDLMVWKGEKTKQ